MLSLTYLISLMTIFALQVSEMGIGYFFSKLMTFSYSESATEVRDLVRRFLFESYLD